MTSGYAAFSTNISLHAKGNIVQSCNIGGKTIKTVTEGDGLYKEEYDEGKCVYKGLNPNNYIQFNNELWRIVAKEADETYKIVRNEVFLEPMTFDKRDTRNTGYCSYGNARWFYCNAWSSTDNMVGNPTEFSNGTYSGVVTLDASLNTYLNKDYYNSLTSVAQSQIVLHEWGIGAITVDNNDLQEQIKEENSYKWTGKIALISVSEYIKANSDTERCGTYNLHNSNSCSDNWMSNGQKAYFLLSPPKKNDPSFVIFKDAKGISKSNNITTYVLPAAYLNPNIKITGGNGTLSNPYTIVS